jgi:hypothetical protein
MDVWILKEYHCPGDVEFPGMHHQGWKDRDSSSYNYYGTSYAANTLCCDRDPSRVPCSFLIPLTPAGSPRCPVPGKTILYFENAARFAMFAPNTVEFNQTGCFWNDGLYADAVARPGHGGPRAPRRGLDICHQFRGRAGCVRADAGPRSGPATSGHAGELPWHRSLVIAYLVRGIGWQRDTFPAGLCGDHPRYWVAVPEPTSTRSYRRRRAKRTPMNRVGDPPTE